MSTTKCHSAKYEGTFVGSKLNNKSFTKECHTPVNNKGEFGNPTNAFYLNEPNSKIFTTIKDLIAAYTKKLLILFLFLAWPVFALEVPTLTGRVVDNANLFTTQEITALTDDIKSFESTTNAQLVVLTIPTLNNQPIEEFSINTATNWQLGQKGKDNGLLFILVKNDKQIRLEVGYGLEPFINDARAGDIIRAITPQLKNKNYFDASTNVINYLQAYITNDTQRQPDTPMQGIKLLVILVFIIILISIMIAIKTQDGCLLFTVLAIAINSKSDGFSGKGGGFGGGGSSGKW